MPREISWAPFARAASCFAPETLLADLSMVPSGLTRTASPSPRGIMRSSAKAADVITPVTANAKSVILLISDFPLALSCKEQSKHVLHEDGPRFQCGPRPKLSWNMDQ